jgi:hypothetical protein
VRIAILYWVTTQLITFNQNQGGFRRSSCVSIASYKTILSMQYKHFKVDIKNGRHKNFITTNYVLNFKTIQIKKNIKFKN